MLAFARPSSLASTNTKPTTTPDTPFTSVKLEEAGQYLDDALEDFVLGEDLELLVSLDAAQGAEYAMGNAASTDQSGAASGGGGGGAPSAGAASGDHNTGGGGAIAPDNPGFARMQGVTAARAEGQRTKPRGPPVSPSQYDFLQVRDGLVGWWRRSRTG